MMHRKYYFEFLKKLVILHTLSNRESNCAMRFSSGWWFTNCHNTNPNGLNLYGVHNKDQQGIVDRFSRGFFYSMKTAEMKVRKAAC